jgi:signal transduction histidine kinase
MKDALDLSLGDIARLEEVIDRESLAEVCRSFFDLFGISIRVFSEAGAMLADVHEEQSICRYVNTLDAGRAACGKTVGEVKGILPAESVVHPCFTGAVYRVVPIDYQGRRVGRFVLGPYLPVERNEVPRSLLVIDDGIDAENARNALADMPRVREETAERLARHLKKVVDLILFSSHRALLTSEMHVASVRESYRELAEKTAALQDAYDRLKELDQLKSNFLATVSHELRTPLTSIIGYSEMLGSGIAGGLNDEQKEFVETIRSKGDHLLSLISNLLDVSKLEQGQVALRRDRVDVGEILKEVVSTASPNARKKGVVVEIEIGNDVPAIVGDAVRLRQVVQNLTDNAIKFTPQHGRVRLVARAAEMEDGAEGGFGTVLMAMPKRAVELVVSDTGIGITPEQQTRIFDPFYQVDGSSTREHGGAGLGLSIVKRLVEAHEGELRVESEVGRGTTFFVTIPDLEDDLRK